MMPIRLVILKSRQEGISTLTEALILHDSATKQYRKSQIISHDPKSTKALFEMSKFFYDNLDPAIKPLQRYNNTKTLVFENPDEKSRGRIPGLCSSIQVSTAAKTEARGETIQNLHGSEVAFWLNAEKLMLALLQQIPEEPDTMVILESTANGVGGYFYDTYWKAKAGLNGFKAIFLPWHEFPEYTRKLEPGFSMTQVERDLKKAFNLTDEQVNWRRFTIANKCGGDENKFKQEYPMTDVEAFIVSGTPKFNQANLKVYYDNRRPPIAVGSLVSQDDPKSVMKPTLQEHEKGLLKIWKYPNLRHSYVIGADTAKGTETSDNASAFVIDQHTAEVVAELTGKIDPTRFGWDLARLGYYYRMAFVIVEVNKDGITTNKTLYEEAKYKRVYKRKQLDNIHEKTQEALGFHTNETTRPIILNNLADWINIGEMGLWSEEAIMECMTFVLNDVGRPEAQEGCHDDRVMALAIAAWGHGYTAPAKVDQKSEVEKNIQLMQQKKEEPNW